MGNLAISLANKLMIWYNLRSNNLTVVIYNG
uniref:Uncharacterized protein n=1 Tax=Arundo donax TaxID=35708 RepID=A0A0A9GKL0_ARUDO